MAGRPGRRGPDGLARTAWPGRRGPDGVARTAQTGRRRPDWAARTSRCNARMPWVGQTRWGARHGLVKRLDDARRHVTGRGRCGKTFHLATGRRNRPPRRGILRHDPLRPTLGRPAHDDARSLRDGCNPPGSPSCPLLHSVPGWPGIRGGRGPQVMAGYAGPGPTKAFFPRRLQKKRAPGIQPGASKGTERAAGTWQRRGLCAVTRNRGKAAVPQGRPAGETGQHEA
jgi:hypothetical protein